MPNILEEFVVAVGFKPDMRALNKARNEGRNAAEQTEQAWKRSAKKVEEAQKEVANASTDAARKTAKATLAAAQKQEKAYREAARTAVKTAKESEKAFEKAADGQKKAAGALREIWTGALRSIGSSLASTALDGARAFADMTVQVTKQGREVSQNAAKVGAANQEYQQFLKSTELVGVQTENAFEALKTFRENLGEVARIGTGPAKDALGSLGIQLDEIIDLPVEEQMTMLAEALKGVEDPAKQLSIAIEVMGEDGQKLLPFLQQGAEGIRQLGVESRAAGAIMSDQMIDTSAKLARKMATVTQQVDGAKLSIIEGLQPALSDAADGMGDWIKQNDALIKQDIPDILRQILDGLKALGPVLEFTATRFRKIGDAFKDGIISGLFELGPGGLGGSIGEGFAGGQIAGDVSGAAAAGDISAGSAAASLGRAARGAGTAEVKQRMRERREARERAARENDPATRERRIRAEIFEAQERQKASGEQVLPGPALPPGKGGKGRRGGGGGRRERLDTSQAVELFGAEFRSLAEKTGVGEVGLESVFKAAARSMAEGSAQGAARQAGLQRLSRLSGRNLTKGSGGAENPLLSSLLGQDVPDVELSTLARGAQPQVLVSNITNNFSFDIDQQITGQGGAVETGQAVASQIRDAFQGALEKATKTAKVRFAR